MVKENRIIIWDDEAKLYFKAAIKYIKQESPQGAEKVRKEILKSINSLSINPLLFEADKFKKKNKGAYRAFTVYHYRVTYKITDSHIYILRLRHTSQDPLEY